MIILNLQTQGANNMTYCEKCSAKNKFIDRLSTKVKNKMCRIEALIDDLRCAELEAEEANHNYSLYLATQKELEDLQDWIKEFASKDVLYRSATGFAHVIRKFHDNLEDWEEFDHQETICNTLRAWLKKYAVEELQKENIDA